MHDLVPNMQNPYALHISLLSFHCALRPCWLGTAEKVANWAKFLHSNCRNDSLTLQVMRMWKFSPLDLFRQEHKNGFCVLVVGLAVSISFSFTPFYLLPSEILKINRPCKNGGRGRMKKKRSPMMPKKSFFCC